MRKLKGLFMDNDSGFTLVEIMIVVFILGIVSAIAIVGVSQTFNSSKYKACGIDVRTVDNAMQAYYNDHFDGTSGTNPAADSGALGTGAPGSTEEILYNTTTTTGSLSNFYPNAGGASADQTGDLVNLKYFSALDPNNNYVVHLTLISGTVPQYKLSVFTATNVAPSATNSITKDANGQIVGGSYVDICKGV